MRVLVVEPYFGGSHRAWGEGYRDHSSHEVTLLTLEARWWKWRMRGGAVTLAELAGKLATSGYRPDVVLVSSMLDLALLRTLLMGLWGPVPTALYMHESQFTYPDSPQMDPDLSYAFTNWTSCLTADAVFFNSEYHRQVFFEEIPRHLRRYPDHRHGHLIEGVAAKASVLSVGVDLSWVGPRRDGSGSPIVLWNHRWEHDKAPGEFFRAASELVADGVDFRVAVCGENPGPKTPPEFVAARLDLADRIEHFGFAPLDLYRNIVRGAAVVVSTARQEFFGISVREAMAAGVYPVLPDRLVYPALIPEKFHGDVLYGPGELVEVMKKAIVRSDRDEITAALAPEAARCDWRTVAPVYDHEMVRLHAVNPSRGLV